mgnify:CR=1 FL=1
MLRNLTPHQVTLVRHGLEPLALPPESPCPRLAETEEAAGDADGTCPERTDLVSPARLLRDAQGRITGCGALALPARRRWARELAEAEHAHNRPGRAIA